MEVWRLVYIHLLYKRAVCLNLDLYIEILHVHT